MVIIIKAASMYTKNVLFKEGDIGRSLFKKRMGIGEDGMWLASHLIQEYSPK